MMTGRKIVDRLYRFRMPTAQGLEYNSVKVVVTDEIEELITHDIFYTAITRARQELKIYWFPETQHKILTGMQPISCKCDTYTISKRHGISAINSQ